MQPLSYKLKIFRNYQGELCLVRSDRAPLDPVVSLIVYPAGLALIVLRTAPPGNIVVCCVATNCTFSSSLFLTFYLINYSLLIWSM